MNTTQLRLFTKNVTRFPRKNDVNKNTNRLRTNRRLLRRTGVGRSQRLVSVTLRSIIKTSITVSSTLTIGIDRRKRGLLRGLPRLYLEGHRTLTSTLIRRVTMNNTVSVILRRGGPLIFLGGNLGLKGLEVVSIMRGNDFPLGRLGQLFQRTHFLLKLGFFGNTTFIGTVRILNRMNAAGATLPRELRSFVTILRGDTNEGRRKRNSVTERQIGFALQPPSTETKMSRSTKPNQTLLVMTKKGSP